MMASYLLNRIILNRLVKNETPPNHTSQIAEDKIKLEPVIPAMQNGALVCRACAGSGCTPLRGSLGDGDIMTALCAITNVSINVDDKLPQYICNGCLKLLESALSFRRRCQDADRTFRANYGTLGNSMAYPYFKHDFQQLLYQMKLKRVRTQERREEEPIRQVKKEKTDKKRGRIKRLKFKCEPCNLSFLSKDELTTHRGKRECQRHPCDVCGQLVLNLRQHARVMHARADAHTCHVCGKQFPIVARLKTHQRVHENTFNFHCEHCLYKSKHKYYLVMHMRSHTGEKPYACALCPATFVNPSNLNKHRATHAARLLPCGSCEKTFRTPTALKEHHSAAHMNIKHSCLQCGRDFCYKSDLRKHEIRHHNRVKRDYIGGEPTYRQVERLQREREQNAMASTLEGVTPDNAIAERDCGNLTLDNRVETQNGRVVTQECRIVTQNGGSMQDGGVVSQNDVCIQGADQQNVAAGCWVQVQPNLMHLLVKPQQTPYSTAQTSDLYVQRFTQSSPALSVLPSITNISEAGVGGAGFTDFTHSNLIHEY